MDQASRILEKLLAGYDLDQISLSAKLESVWEEVVGPAVASHSRPEGLRGSALTVVVDSAAWAQQLQFFVGQIIAKLRERAIPLETVRFRVAPLRKAEKGQPRPVRRALSAEEAEEIRRCCDGVTNEDLRKDLERLLRVSRETGR